VAEEPELPGPAKLEDKSFCDLRVCEERRYSQFRQYETT
jgi:hypothetical protein